MRLPAIVLTAVLGLASCGGDDDTAPATLPTTTLDAADIDPIEMAERSNRLADNQAKYADERDDGPAEIDHDDPASSIPASDELTLNALWADLDSTDQAIVCAVWNGIDPEVSRGDMIDALVGESGRLSRRTADLFIDKQCDP